MVNLGSTKIYIFLISASKHGRLWVLIKTTFVRHFYYVHTGYVLTKCFKKMSIKISTEKNLYKLHGCVFVKKKLALISNLRLSPTTGFSSSFTLRTLSITENTRENKFLVLSPIKRKQTLCIGENKGTDQLRSNCEADHRLCFRYMDSTIPLLSKSKIFSL